MKRDPAILHDERGTTLVFTMLVLFSLLGLTVAGLLATTSDVKISSNYQTGIQALLAAESGIFHAQQRVNDAGVLTSSKTDIVDPWASIFGTSSIQVQGYPLLTYSVTALADATDPVNYLWLQSSGQAPNESQRSIRARFQTNLVYSPGAIYLPSDSVQPNFNGNKFLVDGYDTNLDGSRPTSPNDVPGITTHTQSAANSVTGALSGQQDNNVIGAGGIPSVRMSNGFTTNQLLNEVVPAILANPGVVTDPKLNGNNTFGTCSSSTTSPQITHFTGNVNVTGTVSGCGILIVDNSLTISGNSTFTGLIIVKGTTTIGKNTSDTTMQGNTTITGAVWTTDLQLVVGGSATVTYSTQALTLVNAMFTAPPLPKTVKLISWTEY
jgi:hypothetical protein